MGNLEKRKEKSLKQKPEEEYSGPKPGDTILVGHDEFYEVIKVNHKKKELRVKSFRWDSETTIEFEKFAKEGIILDKPLEEYKRDLLNGLSTDFSSYDEKESTSTEVSLSSGKSQAVAAQMVLKKASDKLAIMTAIMERERSHLMSIKSSMLEKLEQITRVVDIIEIYLGVHEEITQIKEGDPAPADTPISFRQLVLHMDEEVGDTEKGGIDYAELGKFDNWLLKDPKHLQQVLPEPKGVVVLRPRRTDKDYRLEEGDDDLFANAQKNKFNRETYILIRNGGNLYRIFTGNLRIYPNLFPSASEMKKLMEDKENEHRWDKEKKDNKILAYKRNVLMLQGLVDRTNVLRPMPQGVNLLNPDTYQDSVKFIHDADGLLGTGRPSFRDWLKQGNEKLQRGDRLYFVGFPWQLFGSSQDRDTEEIRRRFPVKGSQWNRPESGVFNIKRIEDYTYTYSEKTTRGFVCQHNPKDHVYRRRNYWERSKEDGERKNAIPFRLFEDDTFIINYELLDLEAIEFYLNDRVNRSDYLAMMPVLRGLLKQVGQEKEWEDNFVRFLADKCKAPEELVRDGITWWKTKVIEKRPLRKEDAKAVRMIGGYVKRNAK